MPSLPETFLGAVERSSRWLILPTSDQLWNMLHQCGTHTLSATPTKSKWFNAGVPAMLLATSTSSVTSMLNCLSWPTLEERRRQYRLAVMYRILHNQVDIHWQSFLTKTSSCTRGHSCRLFVPFCKNHVYASSFFPRTSKDWNNLTFDPADAPSLDIFTRKLRNDNA